MWPTISAVAVELSFLDSFLDRARRNVLLLLAYTPCHRPREARPWGVVIGMSSIMQSEGVGRKPTRINIKAASGKSGQQKRRDEALHRQQAARRDLRDHARRLASLAANTTSRASPDSDQASLRDRWPKPQIQGRYCKHCTLKSRLMVHDAAGC